MRAEHCTKSGYNFKFTTSNYGITTTPEAEWACSVEGRPFTPEHRGHNREIFSVEDRMQLELVGKAKLCREEVIAIILYTGPMVPRGFSCIFCIYIFVFLVQFWFQPRHTVFRSLLGTHNTTSSEHVDIRKYALSPFPALLRFIIRSRQFEVYNAVLRQFPKGLADVFSENQFPTTVSVLASAVQKLAREVRIPEGTPLYRGLGGLLELPESFFRPDEQVHDRCVLSGTEASFVLEQIKTRLLFAVRFTVACGSSFPALSATGTAGPAGIHGVGIYEHYQQQGRRTAIFGGAGGTAGPPGAGPRQQRHRPWRVHPRFLAVPAGAGRRVRLALRVPSSCGWWMGRLLGLCLFDWCLLGLV